MLASCSATKVYGGRAVAATPSTTRGNANRRRGAVEVSAKGKSGRRSTPGRQNQQQQAGPAMPDFSKQEGPVFLIMVRSRRVPVWYPVSFINGGTQAEIMTKGMESDWSAGIASGALTREIGKLVYQQEDQIMEAVRAQWPTLKKTVDVQFGYKIVNKEDPMSTMTSKDVNIVPDKDSDELVSPLEAAKSIASGDADIIDAAESTLNKVKSLFGGKK